MSVVEVTSGGVGAMLNFVNECDDSGNEGEEKSFCQHLREYLLILDLASLTGDGIVEGLLRKKAKEALVASKKVPKESEGEFYEDVIKHLNSVADGAYRSKNAKKVSKLLDDAPNILKEWEARIKLHKHEHAYFWKDGKGLLKPITSGSKESVTFSLDQLRRMRGAIVTHNHPLSSSLSPADIKLFLEYSFKEIRAIGKDGTVFSMKLKKKMNAKFKKALIEKTEEYIEEVFIKGKGIKDEATLQQLEAEELIKKLGDNVEYIHYVD